MPWEGEKGFALPRVGRSFKPPEGGGGGPGKGALVAGQSKEANDDSPPAPRSGPEEFLLEKEFPP